jgi:hypothetical protein
MTASAARIAGIRRQALVSEGRNVDPRRSQISDTAALKSPLRPARRGASRANNLLPECLAQADKSDAILRRQLVEMNLSVEPHNVRFDGRRCEPS